MSAGDWEFQQRKVYEYERALEAQQTSGGCVPGGAHGGFVPAVWQKVLQDAKPIPAPPDTPLSLALLEALSPAFGSMGAAFVEMLYLPYALFACLNRICSIPCDRLDTPDPDLCVVRMKNGALGIVRLPQSVLDLAVAQQAAKALTD